MEKVPVGEDSPVLGREQSSGVVHGIETVGADFKGVRGGQGVGLSIQRTAQMTADTSPVLLVGADAPRKSASEGSVMTGPY